MRASIRAEKLNLPSASIVTEGFLSQGRLTAEGFGMPGLPLASIPGHTDIHGEEKLRNLVETVTLEEVIKALTVQPQEVERAEEPEPHEIIFAGSFEEVNEFFYRNKWQEGIPIVPPTLEKVERFLKFTDRSPEEVIGMLLPDRREATAWNVAVNGVMAGCRPEYMPVLISLAEVLADPRYGVEHSGNTPGSEALITLNGPITKELHFNDKQGALRVGFRANTSIGRFFRLYLRNVAGFLPHETDKATFGNTWRVVLAENEEALASMGWKPTSYYQGFKEGRNVVTVSRYTSGGVLVSVFGSKAEEVLPCLADGLVRHMGWELIFTTGLPENPGFGGTQRPHLILSPCLAEVLAGAGLSKEGVRQYLYDHARVPAWRCEQLIGWMGSGETNLCKLVEAGIAPRQFCESSDPNRMVPIVCTPDDFLITVSGDPLRNNAYALISNGIFGYTTSKEIRLPPNWKNLLKQAERNTVNLIG